MQLTVLITGANRGIGLALSHYYDSLGAKVIAVCRTSSQELTRLGGEIIDDIDVTSISSMEKLKQTLSGRTIDILINNAGILRSQSLGNLDMALVLEQFETNTMGPLLVVCALKDNLTKGSKVAFITSRMGSIEDNTSGGSYGYRMSKCALNAAGKSLAIDLKPQGIAVALLHPGYVKTEMVNFGGLISAQDSAKKLACRIENLSLENTGTFWHANGEVLPW